MKAYLNELNPIQQQAVTNTEGPVLVIAGPGSGKTRVLTYRIAHLIEEGAKPWEILSLTFTNKSAREMKERIVKVIGDKGNRVWAGTFHSIFARILRSEAELLGYTKNFTIYDSDDSEGVIKAILKEMNLDKSVYNPNAMKSRISLSKNNLISPKAYVINEELMSEDRTKKRPYFHKIYEEYALRCRRADAMDFDDLLYQFYVLLHRNPNGVLERYQQKFRYFMVDEFQDTNFLQYGILKKLVSYEGSPCNLCVVGDDAQSIYSFRGATIDNILDFEKDFKGMKTFKLEQNYRSTHFIVQAANDIITHNRKQIKKEIWTDKDLSESNKIKVIKTQSDNEEGKRVVDLILEQKNRYHIDNSDIAILYRTNSQSRIFEEFLRRSNIAYRVFGGMSFYQRKEVRDLVAYLRIVVNPNDEEALRRVLNYPRRGIGDSTIDKISELASTTQRPMWQCLGEVAVSTAARKGINDFMDLISLARKRMEKGTAYEVALFVAKQSKLIDTLKSDTTEEGIGRLDNITSLLDGIKDFVENDEIMFDNEQIMDKSLTTYLQNIILLTDADTGEQNPDAVVLMSVHSSKGLEFKSVFVVGLEENLFPSFMAMESAEGIDEERRLFYVAITRAERYLTLTYSNSRLRHGQIRHNDPSRFMEEISASSVESIAPKSSGAFLSEGPSTSKLTGFKPLRPVMMPQIDVSNFVVAAPDKIAAGQRVLHLKFGEGKVLNVEGANDSRMATIEFPMSEEPKKRLVLKFAKLQILE
jgi:DNA helicase II / ATP-dependent DNA helicase PcrA